MLTMASVPQGWHGIPVPSRNSKSKIAAATSTVPTTIRKKWNSPLSSEVPPSKLPSYRPSAVRLQKSAVKNTLPTRSASKSQVDLTASPSKPSPTKELKNDITKLKKELATVKTENSILKVKVRRVDDENIQKSKQIEKLRVELKAAQKNEVTSCKKSKESELLLLRQKCLRLEGALKEKDLLIKKLSSESPPRVEAMELCTQSTAKESSENDDPNLQNSSDNKLGKKYVASVRSNISRTSLPSKGEITKLRDMIHKLEKENQDLQQQVKEKGDEVRRLKLHLRSQTYTVASVSKSMPKKSTKSSEISSPAISASVTKTNSRGPSTNSTLPKKSHGANIIEKSKPNTTTTASKLSVSHQNTRRIPKTTESQEKKIIGKQNFIGNSVKSNLQPRAVPKKQVKGSSLKPPVGKVSSTFVVAQSNGLHFHNSEENCVEEQVERFRENIAAKKIQRSWRNHRKQVFEKKEPNNIEKAMTFIVTSLKYHKMRKEKLNFVGRQKHIIPKLTEDRESAIVDAIRATTKTLWEKDTIENN